VNQQVSASQASLRVSAARWTGKWLLQVPLYLVTSYVIRTLMGSCWRLLIKAGASLPPNYLLEHFLAVGAVGGFLAGLAGILVLRAVLLLPQKPPAPIGPRWKSPQAWTWVLPLAFLLFGMSAWFGGHAHHSVLAAPAGPSSSDLFAAFFGRGCNLTLVGANQWVFQTCMNQLTFTHPFVGTAGYSIAAFVPSEWLLRLRRGDSEGEQPEVIAQTITKQNEQGQIAHL
jgi:hypothetical protein